MIHDQNAIRQELNLRARAMIPALQKRSTQANTDLTLPDKSVQEMQDAGLFKVFQPKRFGGYEMNPHAFFDIQSSLAEGCMSTGWVYGVIAVHAFQLSLFDDQAQQDVWADDPSALVSSSYQPVGKVTPVDGGFRLSGHWSFSSGSEHCTWVLLGAMIFDENGGPPDMRTYLLPKSDYKIARNWDTFGLRGTGSHDIIVDDVFVPEYRTHKAADGFACANPGNAVNTAPLYQIPWAQIFARAVASSAIGACQGALNAFLEISAKRISSNTGQKTIDDPDAQQAVANAMMSIDEMKLVLYRNMDKLVADVNNGSLTSVEERIKFRLDSAVVVEKAIKVVESFQSLLGGRGVFNGSPIVQYFLDVHAARGHVANEPTRYRNNQGAIYLGHDNKDFFI